MLLRYTKDAIKYDLTTIQLSSFVITQLMKTLWLLGLTSMRNFGQGFLFTAAMTEVIWTTDYTVESSRNLTDNSCCFHT